jgi:hypothetical protein
MEERKRLVLTLEELIGAVAVRNAITQYQVRRATPAREEGKSMAEFRYSRSQAEQFLFAQAWDKYHDRFLTRAYVQEGKEAYDEALRKTK